MYGSIYIKLYRLALQIFARILSLSHTRTHVHTQRRTHVYTYILCYVIFYFLIYSTLLYVIIFCGTSKISENLSELHIMVINQSREEIALDSHRERKKEREIGKEKDGKEIQSEE